MPITQQRMLQVLEEAQRLERWALRLQQDLRSVLASDKLSGESKFAALEAMLDASVLPAAVQCAIERDHFRRAARRNNKMSRKMREKRQGATSEEQVK